MPNWTTCKLEAPAEVINKYLSKDKDGYISFDFNLVIPRPEMYSDPDLVCGGDEDLAIYWYLSDHGKYTYEELPIPQRVKERYFTYFSLTYLSKLAHPETEEESEALYERGSKYVYLADTYGYRDWYGWNNANWGTKWNACDTYYDSDTGTCVEFETAWCPPMPVIEKIFKDNPDHEIKFTSYDEDYKGHYELFHDKNNEIHENTYWIDECANDYEGAF